MPITPADMAVSDRIRAENEERTRQDNPRNWKTLEFYVCPYPDCPGYYGALDIDLMEGQWTGLHGLNGEPQPPDRARLRTDCGACFEAGRGRIPMNKIRVTIDPGKQKEPQPRPTTGPFRA